MGVSLTFLLQEVYGDGLGGGVGGQTELVRRFLRQGEVVWEEIAVVVLQLLH